MTTSLDKTKKVDNKKTKLFKADWTEKYAIIFHFKFEIGGNVKHRYERKHKRFNMMCLIYSHELITNG